MAKHKHTHTQKPRKKKHINCNRHLPTSLDHKVANVAVELDVLVEVHLTQCEKVLRGQWHQIAVDDKVEVPFVRHDAHKTLLCRLLCYKINDQMATKIQRNEKKKKKQKAESKIHQTLPAFFLLR
jgi:hypothetical protein